jgi:hypothetical protein
LVELTGTDVVDGGVGGSVEFVGVVLDISQQAASSRKLPLARDAST